VHWWVAPSQSGADAEQLESSMHPTHCRVFGLQIGVEPGHSELFEHSFPQV
jgi:hypothetical protein